MTPGWACCNADGGLGGLPAPWPCADDVTLIGTPASVTIVFPAIGDEALSGVWLRTTGEDCGPWLTPLACAMTCRLCCCAASCACACCAASCCRRASSLACSSACRCSTTRRRSFSTSCWCLLAISCLSLISCSRFAFSSCCRRMFSSVLNLEKRGSNGAPPPVSSTADFVPPAPFEVAGSNRSSMMSMKRSSSAAKASSAASSATVRLRLLGEGGGSR